jgi:outer membrane receptor for ferrienterochelin and colicin
MKKTSILAIILFAISIQLKSQNANDSIKKLDLQEVVITGTYLPKILKEAPQIMTVISRKEIELQNPSCLSDLLMHINGVNIETGTGSGLPNRGIISMNGFPANYTLVLIDGVQVLTDHIQTGQNIDLIPIQNIERIEIIKGASSAQYGSNAMSGVVNIITKKSGDQNEAGLYGSFGSYNSYQAGIETRNRISDKIGTSLFFNWEKSDGAPISAPANRIGKLNYDQANIMGAVEIGYCPKISSCLDFNLTTNKMQGTDGFKRSWQVTSGFNTNFNLPKNVSMNINLPFSQWNSEQNLENNVLTKPQIFVSWTYKDRNILTGGIDYSYNTFTRTAVEEHSQSNIGAFVQDDFKIIKDFTISGALRADKTNELAIVLSPRLSFVYYPIKYIGLRGSAGKAFHAPSTQELYEVGYGHGGTALRFGNPDLKPEYSTTYNLLVEVYPVEQIQFLLNGFYSNIDNMIVPVYEGPWIVNPTKDMWVRQNIYKAVIYGAEFNGRFNLIKNSLQIDAGYTYNYNQNEDTKSTLPYFPGSSINGKVNYNNNIGKNLKFNIFATINAIYNRSAWSWKPAPNTPYNDLNGLVTTLKDYQLLNAGFSVTVFKNYEFFFNANNILGQEIENLDDAYTVFCGLTSFNGGFKIKFIKQNN